MNPKLVVLLSFFIITNGNVIAQYSNIENKSKVPQFNYSHKLAQQEKELRTNPLMLRFQESRKKYEGDRYRPVYHFVSPESRLNDPNGLSFWNGKWHLFYQAYPPEDSRQHWGHAISDDLIHWKDLPYAIYPGPEKAVFSGSVMIEKDRALAMYYGTSQGIMIAESKDPLLLNWKKLNDSKPVIPVKSKDGSPLSYKVYDPFLWKKGDWYYALSGSTKTDSVYKKITGAQFLFKSKDLLNWEYVHDFLRGDRFTSLGDDGACPYFLPIGNRHILLFFSHRSGGQYFLGDYNQKEDFFNASSHGKFNFGATYPSGIHAPSAFSDGKGGVITIFNMNQGRPTASTDGWNQLMSLPRKLTIAENQEDLLIEPAGNIESLRFNHQRLEKLILPANKEIVLKEIKGNTMEIIAEIDTRKSQMLEMNVLRSETKEEYTSIRFFREKGYEENRQYLQPIKGQVKNSVISIETANSSLLSDAGSRPSESADVYIAPNEKLKLRIFIDKSVLEVFVNGKQCLATRVYPSLDDSLGISFKSQGQSSELISIDSWQMKSIY